MKKVNEEYEISYKELQKVFDLKKIISADYDNQCKKITLKVKA